MANGRAGEEREAEPSPDDVSWALHRLVVAAAAPCVWRVPDRAGLALYLGVVLGAAVLVGGLFSRMAKV